jgi:hypothetical protein
VKRTIIVFTVLVMAGCGKASLVKFNKNEAMLIPRDTAIEYLIHASNGGSCWIYEDATIQYGTRSKRSPIAGKTFFVEELTRVDTSKLIYIRVNMMNIDRQYCSFPNNLDEKTMKKIGMALVNLGAVQVLP